MLTNIAKSIHANKANILIAINNAITKANDDLVDKLKSEGFADASNTVKSIENLEELIAELLNSQSNELLNKVKDIDNIDELTDTLNAILASDNINDSVANVVSDMFSAKIPTLANIYMKELDDELNVDIISQKTTSWIKSWSNKLGELMKISTHEQMSSLIADTITNGDSIADLTSKIQLGEWRNEYYQAKRVAVTEVLRAHSVAREESLQQCPVVDRKEWRHSGTHKNDARENHIAMDRQIVPKDEPFVLTGKNGSTYYPEYPCDTSLPPAESINCHCIHRGIPNDDILGLSLEERKELQTKAREAIDDKWINSLDEENKAKAGINEETIKIDWLKSKSKEDQIKYFGGVKSKWALVESGVISDDKGLDTMFKSVTTTKNGVTTTRKNLKTLQELADDGIMTVNNKDLEHSTFGEFTNVKNPKKPPGGKNGGKMSGGGHSQSNISILDEKGYVYKIEKTYDNGVRIGGIAEHKENNKRLGSTGQAWFPEDWSDDDVLVAGTYVANNYDFNEDVRKYARFNDVTVGVIVDTDNKIKTIFPDELQREWGRK